MFSAVFYLVFGSLFLVMGVTGKGFRPDLAAEKQKLGRKILTFCGAGLLVGALWAFLEIIL